nr:hypothetical protein [Tanacetum cinerariifolium]
MAISIISVSPDSSEESVRTPAGQVILFGSILTHIPNTTPTETPLATHLDTTLIPIEIPTISPIIPLSPDYTPASPDCSPASDTETDPFEDPSTDHIPPLPATSPFLSSIDDSLDSDIPDTPPSPTHVDYSSLDHFTSDDSSRDSSSSSSSSSSSETSSDSLSDDLSNSSSSHSSSDHSLPALPSGTRSSCHLCLLVPSIPRSSAAAERPSHSSVQAEIDECIAYADALRARGIDAGVVVEDVDGEEIETGTRGPFEDRVDRVAHLAIPDGIPEPAQEAGAVDVTYETLGDLV